MSLCRREIAKTVARVDLRSVESFAEAISTAVASDRSIYTFGNGGSAGLACHLATELMHIAHSMTLEFPVRAVSLAANDDLLTALANDYGFERIFEVQLHSLLRRGDVVIVFSSSGRSKNVLRGLRVARLGGAIVLGLTGARDNFFIGLCDHFFHAASKDVYAIETAHLCFIHLLSMRVRALLAGQEHRGKDTRKA